MQQAVSSPLFECVLHVPEAGPIEHGAGEELGGHHRSEEGKLIRWAFTPDSHAQTWQLQSSFNQVSIKILIRW